MPTRTKRLPCGRTKAELRKGKSRLLKLIEITEAAERGETIEFSYGGGREWAIDQAFDPIMNAHLNYRIAKPKRGAK